MKKISTLSLAFTFTGCFLGAGFVSGQELWQFFGSFGKAGIVGIIAAVFFLAFFSFIVIELSQSLGTGEMDKIVVRSDSRFLRGAFSFFEIFFLFGIYVVMTAGAGALFEQMFGLSKLLTAVIFVFAVFLVAVFGARGMITAFSITVPLLVIMCVVIFAVNIYKGSFSNFSLTRSDSVNPLTGNPIISAAVYISYNFFAAIGIMSPLGDSVKSKKSLVSGLLLGEAMLLLIALSIILTILCNPSAALSQLPMLQRAQELNGTLGIVFAFFLLMGMFGASVSSVFAINEYAKSKTDNKFLSGNFAIAILCILSVGGSLFGFDNLVGTVFPVCGYIGFAALAMLLANYIKEKKSKT